MHHLEKRVKARKSSADRLALYWWWIADVWKLASHPYGPQRLQNIGEVRHYLGGDDEAVYRFYEGECEEARVVPERPLH